MRFFHIRHILFLLWLAILLVFQTAYANQTKHYYTFLAKAKADGPVEAAPALSTTKLKDLPLGEYYLHIVSVEGTLRDGYTLKLTVANDTVNGGILVNTVSAIATIPNIVINKQWAKKQFSVLAHGKGEFEHPLSAILRRLVVSDKYDKYFIKSIQGKTHHIHRLHKLTIEKLNKQTLIALWRLWQPMLEDYNDSKSVRQNLTVLEKSIRAEAKEDDGSFHYVNRTRASSKQTQTEQSHFVTFFHRFVLQLKNDYDSVIRPKREAATKQLNTLQTKTDNAIKKYNTAIKKFKAVKEQDSTNSSLTMMKKSLDEAKKLVVKLKEKIKLSISHYNNEDHASFNKEIKKIPEDIAKLTISTNDVINTADPILGDSGEMSIAETIIVIFSIILTLITIYFVISRRKKTEKDSVKKTDCLKNLFYSEEKTERERQRIEKDRHRQELRNPRKKNKEESPLKTPIQQQPPTIIEPNPQLKGSIAELQTRIKSLTSENKRLKNMITLKDTELLRIAQNHRFVDELFHNMDTKHHIKNIVAQYKNENDKSIRKRLKKLEDTSENIRHSDKEKPIRKQLQQLENTTQKQYSSLEATLNGQLKAYKNDLFKQLDKNLSDRVLHTELEEERQIHQKALAEAKQLTDNLAKEIQTLKQQLEETNQRIPTLNAVQLEAVRLILEKNAAFDSSRWIQWLTNVSQPADVLKRLLNAPDITLSSTIWHELDQWLQNNTNKKWCLHIPEPNDRYTKKFHQRVATQKGQKVPGLIAFCEKPGLQYQDDVIIKADVKITTT